MYIFDILTNPFIAVMVLLYQVLAQNYVLAIIVFTILVQAVTYPLTRAQLQSTKKMQELQPRLKKLQEKYKGDREKLSQAQMELYRQYGVNPAAGCLPLIIQMPVLIGLYSAISHTLAATPLQVLDLHHRLIIPELAMRFPLNNHFMWLNLGLPDTTPILPLLVVATTWLRTKMTTPTPTDSKDPTAATSRTMLVMMPLMIGLFSVNFASGLSIYWVASNVVGVVQYALTGRVNLRTLSAKSQSVVSPVIEDEDDEPVKPKSLKAGGGSSGDKRPQPVSAAARAGGTGRSGNGSSNPSTGGAAKNRPRVTPKKRK